jgi:hypothetical protein
MENSPAGASETFLSTPHEKKQIPADSVGGLLGLNYMYMI